MRTADVVKDGLSLLLPNLLWIIIIFINKRYCRLRILIRIMILNAQFDFTHRVVAFMLPTNKATHTGDNINHCQSQKHYYHKGNGYLPTSMLLTVYILRRNKILCVCYNFVLFLI